MLLLVVLLLSPLLTLKKLLFCKSGKLEYSSCTSSNPLELVWSPLIWPMGLPWGALAYCNLLNKSAIVESSMVSLPSLLLLFLLWLLISIVEVLLPNLPLLLKWLVLTPLAVATNASFANRKNFWSSFSIIVLLLSLVVEDVWLLSFNGWLLV